MNETAAAAGMTIRRITLADGRYMILYSFLKEILKRSDKAAVSHDSEARPSRQAKQKSDV